MLLKVLVVDAGNAVVMAENRLAALVGERVRWRLGSTPAVPAPIPAAAR